MTIEDLTAEMAARAGKILPCCRVWLSMGELSLAGVPRLRYGIGYLSV